MNEEKEQDDIQAVNKEQQEHEHSTTTQELVVDDEQDNIQAVNEDKQEQDDMLGMMTRTMQNRNKKTYDW